MKTRKLPIVSVILTMLAFICFILVYLLLTCFTIVPHFGTGLLFAIPFLVLGSTTLLAWRGKLSFLAADILSGILAPVFVIGALFLCMVLALTDAATDNPAYYSRVLRLSDVKDTAAAELFPDQIPENATDVRFYYTPPILQGGEVFALSFVTDEETIQAYEALLSEKAMWYGDAREQPTNTQSMVYPAYFEGKGYYSGIYYKEGFTLYMLFGLYGVNTPNHASTCYAWVNPDKCELVLCYERW